MSSSLCMMSVSLFSLSTFQSIMARPADKGCRFLFFTFFFLPEYIYLHMREGSTYFLISHTLISESSVNTASYKHCKLMLCGPKGSWYLSFVHHTVFGITAVPAFSCHLDHWIWAALVSVNCKSLSVSKGIVMLCTSHPIIHCMEMNFSENILTGERSFEESTSKQPKPAEAGPLNDRRLPVILRNLLKVT